MTAVNANKKRAPMVGGIRALSDFPPINSGHINPDWIAGPCVQCPTSDNIETSNFDSMLDRLDALDPYGADWDTLRFPVNLPGVQWMEVAFARPGSACVRELGIIREELKTSSVINAELFLTREAYNKGVKDAA